MAHYERPTLAELIAAIAADLESRLPGTGAKLRRKILTTTGRAQAGAAHGLHGHLSWLASQILPDRTSEESLKLHGNIWGVPRKTADWAVGPADLTGTDTTVIPAGTEIQSVNAIVYTTDEEAVIAAGVATVAVTAVEVGVDGNLEEGIGLTLINPIDDINSAAVVGTGGLTGGLEIETLDAWWARIIGRIQAPPHGGRVEDYEIWALEVAGITRVWVRPLHLGVGTVGIFIVSDDQVGTIIPDEDKVTEVQDYIDALRPVTAEPTVFPPVPVALDMTIAVVPDTAAVRAAVTAELDDLLRREAEPGGITLLSHLNEAISVAEGETDHTLTVPAADVNNAAGELSVLGDITWA